MDGVIIINLKRHLNRISGLEAWLMYAYISLMAVFPFRELTPRSSEVSGLCPDQAFVAQPASVAVLQNISCPVDGAGYHVRSFSSSGVQGWHSCQAFC